MKKRKLWSTFLSLSLVFSTFALTGCTKDKQDLKPLRTKFAHVNYDGSFVVKSANGKIKVDKDFTDDKKLKQFEWYMDPLCGDCIKVHSATHDYIEKAVSDREMEIKYHPLNMLSHHSEDINYSLKGSAWIVGIADSSSEHIFNFMSKLLSKQFKTDHVKSETLEKDLYDLAIESGVPKLKARRIMINLEVYEDAVNRGSVNIRKMKKWAELSPKEDKAFFIPFIYNANLKGTKAFLGESEDTEKHVLAPLKGEISCTTDCD